MVELFTPEATRGDGRGIRLEERVYTGLLDDIRLGKFTLGQRTLPPNTAARVRSVVLRLQN